VKSPELVGERCDHVECTEHRAIDKTLV